MNKTDYIEMAVLQEIEKYEYGTFTDAEIVVLQVDAVESCPRVFDPIERRAFIAAAVTKKYAEIY